MSGIKLSKRAEGVLGWIKKQIAVMPAEAGIQNQSPGVLDASLRWHDKVGRDNTLPIRQQSLAEHFGCSRRTIGRALKQLKEAGKLVDLNKRHKNRCKMYQLGVVMPAEAPELSCQRRLASSSMSRPTLDASLRWHDKVGQDPGLRQGDNRMDASLRWYDKYQGLTPQAREQWKRCLTPIKMVFGNEKDLDRRYAYVTSHLTHVMDPDELWQKTFAGLFCVYKYGQVNPDFKGMTLEQIAYARCVPERHQR